MTPPKPQSTIASELDNPGGVTTRGPRLLRQVIVKYVVNWPNRLREMASFVGLEEEDHQLIQDSAGIVMDNAEGLTEAVYDNFLKFPESRRFFLTPEGEIDHDRVARRKHSLVRWLRGTTKYTIDESFAVALLATGISHSHPPRPPGPRALQTHDRSEVLYPDRHRRAAPPGNKRPQAGTEDQRRLEQATDSGAGHTAGRVPDRIHR